MRSAAGDGAGWAWICGGRLARYAELAHAYVWITFLLTVLPVRVGELGSE